MLSRIASLTIILLLAVCSPAQEVSQSGLELSTAVRPMVAQPVRAPKAMIATVNELATDAGLAILRQGGNSVDAAVAVGFALAVVHPEAGNLGGSGYMLLRMKDGRTAVFDYAGTAPAAARPGMFANRREALVGYKSIAVPGTPAGLGMAHERFGKLSWAKCLEPARQLARKGFAATLRMELILRLQVPVMKAFPETARVLLHGSDQPLKQGEKLVQPDLARTIERMQKKGWREFYTGETARLIAEDMARNGGLITREDLGGYRAEQRDPIRVTYRGNPVLTMPPSSSGGVVIAAALNVLERFPLAVAMEGSAQAHHLQIEALRRGYELRRDLLRGPAQQTDLSLPRITSKEYAAGAAFDLLSDRATPRTREAAAAPAESPDTTHFSIIDPEGNMVSNTYTLSEFYGSQVIARGTGVLLNDHMSVFSNLAASPNAVAPGKRYASTMSPTLILHPDGSPWAAFGTPGGGTIPSTIVQIVTNLIDFKMSLRDALEFPRLHLDIGQNRIDAEPAALVFDVAEKLKQMGHAVNPKLRTQGDVQAVVVEDDDWRVGWADGRRGGAVKGY